MRALNVFAKEFSNWWPKAWVADEKCQFNALNITAYLKIIFRMNLICDVKRIDVNNK